MEFRVGVGEWWGRFFELEFRVGVGEWWGEFFIKFSTQRRGGV